MSGKVNNPFGPPPQTAQQVTANKYPDVSQDPALLYASQARQQEQQQQQYLQAQQQQQQQQQYQGFQQPYSSPSYLQPAQTAYLQPSPTGFAPQSSFGQQLSAQVTGYGGTSPQPGYGGAYNGGYQSQAQSQQQQQQFTDLDPYAHLNTLSNAGQQSSSFSGSGSGAGGSSVIQGGVPPGTSHPRQYVQENRDALMRFDDYSWKQMLSRLDTLRQAWEARKSAVIEAGRQGGDPTQIEQLRREADLNVDNVHAAKFQLAEVQQGWMQSTDPASKARVREALNAGLRSLPEYPPMLGPEQLGGQLGQRAHEDARKQAILSGFNPQQQQHPQQGQPFASQPTGYGASMQQQQQFAPQPTGYGGYQQGYVQSQPTGFYPGQQQQQQQYGYYG